MILLKFDCVNKKYRIVFMDIYDENSNILLSASEVNDKWHDIISRSVNEKLKDTVCSVDKTSDIKGEK